MSDADNLLGAALVRLHEVRSDAAARALLEVRAAPDPAAALARLEGATREYVELALLTTLTTGLCADRWRGVPDEAIAARARTIPAPLYERLQAMVAQQWPRWGRRDE